MYHEDIHGNRYDSEPISDDYVGYHSGYEDDLFTYDQAIIVLKELAHYLDTLDPSQFDQENFFGAVNQDDRCGCIAAHSIWTKGKTRFPTGVNLEDSPAYRAAAIISEHDEYDETDHHQWSQYLFEVESEGEEHAYDLDVSYYDATAKGGAARIREFLLEHGEYKTNKGFYVASENLEDLV